MSDGRRSLYPASQLTFWMVCPGRPSHPNSVVVLLLVPVRCCKRDFHTRGGSRQRASGRAGIIIRRRRPPQQQQQQQQQNKTEMDGDRDQPIFLAAGGDTTGSVSTARRLCPRGRRVRTNFSTSRKSRSTRPPRETLRRETSRFWTISKKNRDRASRRRRLHHHPQLSLARIPQGHEVTRGGEMCEASDEEHEAMDGNRPSTPFDNHGSTHLVTAAAACVWTFPPLPPSRPGPPTPGRAEI